MAEVASSYPTAGGLYYWSAKLAPASGRNPATWSWFVGWFNLVGQVAVTAGIDFGLALFTTAFLNLAFGVRRDADHHDRGLRRRCSFLHALLNTFGIRLVKLLNDVSVWWHIVGVTVIVIVCVVLNQHTTTSRHGLLDDRQQHRLRWQPGLRPAVPGHPPVRGADRPAERAVHADRVRRLGPHVRGDARRRHVGAARASSSRSSSRSSSGSSSWSR